MLKTLESILKYFEKCRSLRSLKHIHAQVLLNGLNHDNYLAVKFISFCSSTLGNIAYARLIFDNFGTSPNVFLWTTMITSYTNCQSEVTREAFLVYRLMHQQGTAPNHFTLSTLIKACTYLESMQEGLQIHAHSNKLGFNSSIYVQTTLVHMYANFGWVQEARELYDTVSIRNVALCNVMITCYTKVGDIKSSQEIFDGMQNKDLISWNVMISGYAHCGNMLKAREIFDRMPERDIDSWNALIAGYCLNREWHIAILMFKEMHLGTSHVEPDHVSMTMLISACGHLGALEIGLQLHGFLRKSCINMNSFVLNSLVDMYAKCGNIDEAYAIFSEMPIKDLVSYNIMISGFASHGQGEKSLNLFDRMLEIGIQPDVVTFTGILTACSHAGLLNAGRKYFSCMKRLYGVEPSADHYACMVDLYGRAGFVDEAHELVKNMEVKPHEGVWGALLNACRAHGDVEIGKVAALELFRIEPRNPGNYVLLSNIYAKFSVWDGVAACRRLMTGRGISKTSACSWIELNGVLHEFSAGDSTHPSS